MEVFERSFEENIEIMQELLKGNRMTRFRTEYLALHSYDQARIFLSFEQEYREKVYQYLSPSELANVFDAVETEQHEYMDIYFEEMNNSYAATVLGDMYADNAVDILNNLKSHDLVNVYMQLMKPSSAREISQLINYLDDTAGSIMTTEFVSVQAEDDLKSAYEYLKSVASTAETIYYVYVVD